MAGWWFGTWLEYISFHIWDVILPIDEVHHFSRWLLHHQPVLLNGYESKPSTQTVP